MRQFDEHFLMSHDDVREYVSTYLGLFEEMDTLVVEEIGDGNINYVFKVTDPNSNKSVVVKQADILLRSSGRPLDINRNKIEADILKIQYDLMPEYIPEIYDYNEKMAALTMEDISAYKNLRYELLEKRQFPKLAEEISEFMANVLVSTSDLVWDRKDKKEQVKNFINIDMCDISEDLVFTEPYYDYKNQNIILEDNKEFVEEFVYQNEELSVQVAILRDKYMNYAQSLVHGDLHSGSIFANQEGIKIIDPEFAFYGPMGYDIGNVIGNLFFSLAHNDFFNTDASFKKWLSETIVSIYDLTKEKMSYVIKEKTTLPLYQNASFIENYVSTVMQDALGYAGTEMIRRTIGDSKVKEISSAPETSERIQMERVILTFAIDCIMDRDKIETGDQLIRCYRLVKSCTLK
ncbi:S-methyl-5-thioribose kinase [Vagococcus martis]|uniref:S-methyl-5-thioribose kinase n=1 Tax=Vagococcus martis TaxID=1768210 RepID=A0A1V4DH36_9ENTE|nr:S-methyl-5-thioribose kinase [Vagococcus martis]OPF87762.1 S-methyl-5-thioribose kinase [Vagococcus martis]